MRPLEGKRVLFLVNQVNFRDEELLQPREEVTAAGAEAVVASRDGGEARGMLGAVEPATARIVDARAGDFDAVVAVGGKDTPAWLWVDGDAHRLLREAKEAGKVVAGICLSGATLAIAGVLGGVEATCWPTEASLGAMRAGGARYADRPVVTDGKVVTASGPPAAREFGRALVRALSAP